MKIQLILGIIGMVLGTLISIFDCTFVSGIWYGWILGFGIVLIIVGYIFIAGASMFPPVVSE
jgi:hypothetical protein